MTIIDYTMSANFLNSLITRLNGINESYPRCIGQMVMISSDTEDEIDHLVNEIEEVYTNLKGLDDDTIAGFTDDVDDYRRFLNDVGNMISANREEIHRAREFLERYHAI